MAGKKTAAKAKRSGTDVETRRSSKKRKTQPLQPDDNRPLHGGELHGGAAMDVCDDNAAASSSAAAATAAASHVHHTETAERIKETGQPGVDASLRQLQQARRGAAENNGDRSEHRPISKYRGVVWCKKSNCWTAHWGAQGKVNLGIFDSEEAAADAVQKAQLESQGDTDDISQEAELAASGADKPIVTAANESIYRGVSWHAHNDLWVANIKMHGEQIWLGSYKTEEEAAMAVGEARKDPSRNKASGERQAKRIAKQASNVALMTDGADVDDVNMSIAAPPPAAVNARKGVTAAVKTSKAAPSASQPVSADKPCASLHTLPDSQPSASPFELADQPSASPIILADQSAASLPIMADHHASADGAATRLHEEDRLAADAPTASQHHTAPVDAVPSNPLWPMHAEVCTQITQLLDDYFARSGVTWQHCVSLLCCLQEMVTVGLTHQTVPRFVAATRQDVEELHEKDRLAADDPSASQHHTAPIDAVPAVPSNPLWPMYDEVCMQIAQLLDDYFARSDVTWQHCVSLLCCLQEMVTNGLKHQTVPRFVATAPQNADAEVGAIAANAASNDACAPEREAKLQRKLQRMRNKYQAAKALLQQHDIDMRKLRSTRANTPTHNAVLTQQPHSPPQQQPCQHHAAKSTAKNADASVCDDGELSPQETTAPLALIDASAAAAVVAVAAPAEDECGNVAGCCAPQRSDACSHCAHLTAQVSDLSLLVRQQTKQMTGLQGELQATQRTAEQQSLGWQSEQEQWQRSQQEWQSKQEEWQSSQEEWQSKQEEWQSSQEEWQSSQEEWQSKQEEWQSNEDELRVSNAAMQAECELLKQQLAEKQGAVDQLQGTLGVLFKSLEGSCVVLRDAIHAQHGTVRTQCGASHVVQHDTQQTGQQQQVGSAVDAPEVHRSMQKTTQELEARLAQAEARCAELKTKLQSKTKRLHAFERRQKTAIADLERLATLPDDSATDA